jgi:5-methylcytosine-specific restriction endonuclease McrA
MAGNNPVPTLRSLDKLSLSDLKKIERAIFKFDEREKETERKNAIIRRKNEESENTKKRKDSEFEAWKRNTFKPEVDLLTNIINKIENCESIVWTRLFSNTVEIKYRPLDDYLYQSGSQYCFQKTRVIDAALGRSLQSEYDRQEKIVDALSEKASDFYYFRRPDPYLDTIDVVNMTIGGSKVKVDLGYVDRQKLVGLIASHNLKKAEQDKKTRHIKARAADKESAVRGMAKQYKKGFEEQKRLVDSCPYCGGAINQSDAQLDHIYPVSKGGLSTEENLVFVCSSCNRKKSNDTIRSFIEGAGFNSDIIYGRLKVLNKDF